MSTVLQGAVQVRGIPGPLSILADDDGIVEISYEQRSFIYMFRASDKTDFGTWYVYDPETGEQCDLRPSALVGILDQKIRDVMRSLSAKFRATKHMADSL